MALLGADAHITTLLCPVGTGALGVGVALLRAKGESLSPGSFWTLRHVHGRGSHWPGTKGEKCPWLLQPSAG